MEADVEIEALHAIFGDEITIETNQDRSLTKVRKKVRPNDEEGVSSASIVVELELGPKYPEVSPIFRLINPRGISEQSHRQLIGEVAQRINESTGLPVIFDVLQHCADFILEHQHSSSLLCPICLCPMMPKQVSATPCDHYAHSSCLDLHVEHTRKQLGEKLSARDFKMCGDIDKSLRCPVCRVVIEKEVDPILPSSRRSSPKKCESPRSLSQQGSHFDFEFDWEKWRQQQASMLVIYEKQKEKGGIIDLEEERKKTLVTEDTVVVLSSDLEGMGFEHSVSDANDNSCCEPVNEIAAGLDNPPKFVEALPAGMYGNTLVNENHFRHRGRNRGRKFHDRIRDGHQRKEHRGGHRSVPSNCSKNNVSTVQDTSTLAESSSATTSAHYYITRRSNDNLTSGMTPTHHRGTYQHKSFVHWRQPKDKSNAIAQVDSIHE